MEKIIPIKEVDEMFDLVVKTEKTSIERDGSLMAKFFICRQSGSNAIVAAPFMPDGYDAKAKMLEAMGTKMAEEYDDVLGILMTAEAWMSVLPKNIGEKLVNANNFPRPSLDPQRKEVVMFTAKDINDNFRVSMYFIERKDGQVTLAEEKTGDIGSVNSIGWMDKDSKMAFDLNLLDCFYNAYRFTSALKKLYK